MKYQLTRCSSTTLNDVPIQDGQIIYVKDTGEHYLDVDTQRIKITNKTLEQNVQDIIDSLNTKVEQTSEINKIYGTNETGNQTTFNKDDLNKVDDVQVDGVSILNDKVANIDIQSVKTDYTTKIDNLTQTVNTNKTNTDNSITEINNTLEDLSNTVSTDKESVNTNITNLQNNKLDKTFASSLNNSITGNIEFSPSGLRNGVYIKATMINPTNSQTQEFGSYLYSSNNDIKYTGKEDGIETTIPKLETLDTKIDTTKTELEESIDTINTNLTSSITALTSVVDNNKTELDNKIEEINTNIENLDTNLTNNINTTKTELESKITSNTNSINTINETLSTQTNNIKELTEKVNINTENITTNTNNISTINTTITSLSNKVDELDTSVETMSETVTTVNEDMTDVKNRLNTAEGNITTNTTNISNNTQSIGNINDTLESQASSISVLETQTETNRVTTEANTVAIQGLVNQFDTYHHYFQGYYEHTADIEELEAERGDYAYNGETNTIWAFDTVWSNTFDPIPSDMGGKTQTTPLMDGEASVGSENYYAAGDHRHPTDITRASVEDLTSHKNNKQNPHNVTKEQVGLGNVDNTSDINKPVSTAVQTELELKQNITDNSLLTDSKIIPNSINEVYTNLKTIQDLMAQTYLIYKHNNFEITNGKTINFQLREFVDIDDAMIIDENYNYTNSKNTYRLLSTESSITELGFCSNGWIGFTQNNTEYVYLNQKFMEMFARELGMTNEGYQGDGWYKYTMSFGQGVINMDFEKINYTQLSDVQTMKISSITEGAEATPVTSINSNNLQYMANFIKIVE